MPKLLTIAALDTKCEIDMRHPPLGIGYLSASVKREYGDRFDIRLVVNDVERALDEWRPDVVLVSSTSPRFDIAHRYAALAHARGLPVVIGGIHISMLPHSLYPEMTVGVIGEGERTLIELLELYLETKGFPQERLAGIQGLCYRREEDGAPVLTEPRPCITPLDDIPLPDRSLMPIRPHTYMFTSRGCPFKCRFCASTRFWPGKVRFFSAERVVDEIELLIKDFDVRVISFHDDLFVADHDRLHEIARLMERRNLLNKVTFTCNARANIVTDELCKVLKHLGVASVNMGLESGSDKTLAWLKGNVTVAQNENAILCIRRHGMQAQGSFIVGAPDETEADIEETYRFIKRMPLSIVDVNLLLPYPGTAVWEIALEKGLVSNDMDWGQLTYDVRIDPMRYLNMSNHVSTERLVKLHSRFMRLRYWKIMKGIVHHPYKRDLVKWGARYVAEYFRRDRKPACAE